MRGGTRIALLGVLVAGALVATALAVFFGRSAPAPHAGAHPSVAAPDEAQPPSQSFEGRVELGTGPTDAAPGAFPSNMSVADRLNGTGRLEILAFATDGATFPEHWLFSLAPSKVLVAGEHAVARQFTFDHGERQLVLEDLPLGGYELRAFANGLCAREQHLMLAKPDDVNVIAHVVFYPAGFLTGRVVDAQANPVEGVGVVLEELSSRERRATNTDPAGVYLFESVLDGEYALFVGEPNSPLTNARDIAFSAPSLHMADIQVPVLGEIAIQVVDRRGHPVAGARIEGYGIAGGRVALVSDDQGRALARHLPAGDATLIATTEDGNQGRERVTLSAGARAEVTLRLRK